MTTTTTTKSKVSVTISENGPYIVTGDILLAKSNFFSCSILFRIDGGFRQIFFNAGETIDFHL